MNVLYVVNSVKDNNLSYSKDIIEYLKSKDINVFVLDNLLTGLNVNIITDFSVIDLVVILGGDGTILKYARNYGKYNIPILGINMGRVGALAIAKTSNYKELIDKYLSGDYYITENLTLQGKLKYNHLEEKEFIIYNDVMIHRGISYKLLPIYIGINNARFDKIYADGVVIATPSGSSAYNFSAGGPLLSHNSNCYVITPICPQTRGFNSLVVSNDEVVRLAVDVDNGAYLCIDGCEQYDIKSSDEVIIYKSDYCLRLVNFSKQNSIYETVYKVMKASSRGENDV